MIGVIRVVLTLNVEQAAEAAEAAGNDALLVKLFSEAKLFLDAIFDPAGAWTLWLCLGAVIGGHIYAYGRDLEDRVRGRLGGPPFWYLRLQARLVRFGIKHRWYQRLNRDLNANLESIATVLPRVHGFPQLPTDNFDGSEEELALTSEYLRRIIPNLSAKHIQEAKETAFRFDRQPKPKLLGSLLKQ